MTKKRAPTVEPLDPQLLGRDLYPRLEDIPLERPEEALEEFARCADRQVLRALNLLYIQTRDVREIPEPWSFVITGAARPLPAFGAISFLSDWSEWSAPLDNLPGPEGWLREIAAATDWAASTHFWKLVEGLSEDVQGLRGFNYIRANMSFDLADASHWPLSQLLPRAQRASRELYLWGKYLSDLSHYRPGPRKPANPTAEDLDLVERFDSRPSGRRMAFLLAVARKKLGPATADSEIKKKAAALKKRVQRKRRDISPAAPQTSRKSER